MVRLVFLVSHKKYQTLAKYNSQFISCKISSIRLWCFACLRSEWKALRETSHSSAQQLSLILKHPQPFPVQKGYLTTPVGSGLASWESRLNSPQLTPFNVEQFYSEVFRAQPPHGGSLFQLLGFKVLLRESSLGLTGKPLSSVAHSCRWGPDSSTHQTNQNSWSTQGAFQFKPFRGADSQSGCFMVRNRPVDLSGPNRTPSAAKAKIRPRHHPVLNKAPTYSDTLHSAEVQTD